MSFIVLTRRATDAGKDGMFCGIADNRGGTYNQGSLSCPYFVGTCDNAHDLKIRVMYYPTSPCFHIGPPSNVRDQLRLVSCHALLVPLELVPKAIFGEGMAPNLDAVNRAESTKDIE